VNPRERQLIPVLRNVEPGVDLLSAVSIMQHASDGTPPVDFPMRWTCIERAPVGNVYEVVWYDDCWEDEPGAIYVAYPDAPFQSGWWVRRVTVIKYEPGDESFNVTALHGEMPYSVVDELVDDITADEFSVRGALFRRAA
jgi:hypothetical protein